jgi:hypothetical protein
MYQRLLADNLNDTQLNAFINEKSYLVLEQLRTDRHLFSGPGLWNKITGKILISSYEFLDIDAMYGHIDLACLYIKDFDKGQWIGFVYKLYRGFNQVSIKTKTSMSNLTALDCQYVGLLENSLIPIFGEFGTIFIDREIDSSIVSMTMRDDVLAVAQPVFANV